MGMPKIPVTFIHEGKEYSGTLGEVSGAAGKIWHLHVDDYYWGQLIFGESGFVFYAQNNTQAMLYLSEQFGEAITLWYS